MCGIFGTTKLYSEDTIRKKIAKTNFRGPDFSDFKTFSNNLTFGHNRLAIIDLDDRSNQPFEYENLTIVFNGEIFNFQEIRSCLISDGYVFSTLSDTEVICASYLKWGEDCVKKFNGMFSFVIFDYKNDILFGARDRLGKKPFYYLFQNGHFEFASQPSVIAIGNSLTLSNEAISQFLVWSFIPEPNSIYNEVSKLLPGHRFIYDLKNEDLTISKYWELDVNPDLTFSSFSEAKGNLKSILDDSVKLRMIADVPIGVFLSGGTDSSLVTAIAQNYSINKINTFCIKFSNAIFDESRQAESIAKYLGTHHNTIECNPSDLETLLDNYFQYFDEPFGDSSAIPTMLISKQTKKSITVALSGDGGDEFFMGYTRYDWINYFDKIFKLPLPIRQLASQVVKNIPFKYHDQISKILPLNTIDDAYKSILAKQDNNVFIDPSLSDYKYFDNWLKSSKNIIERVSDYDIKNYLNNDINTKVDRSSMAYALEIRSPLMDYRILEFSKKIPTGFKHTIFNKKIILKDILYDYIPQKYFSNKKNGFGAPISNWFKDDLKALLNDTITKNNLDLIPNINSDYIMKLLYKNDQKYQDNSVLFWNLIILINWIKKNKY
jgi:asparagine synthase (glutamine-hydrolysing)